VPNIEEYRETVHVDGLGDVEIVFSITPDDTPFRGNLTCSGDDLFDQWLEDETAARLEDGDVWAWALVCVQATHVRTRIESDRGYLGGCSYDSADEFRACGYFDDMRSGAIENLRDRLVDFGVRLSPEA